MKTKIIYLTTHPINYFTDLYRYIQLNTKSLFLEAWFCTSFGIGVHYDDQFNNERYIDEGILSGFSFKFLSGKKRLTNRFFFNWSILKHLKNSENNLIICHGWQNLTLLFVLFFGKYFDLNVGLRAEQPLDQELRKGQIVLFLRKIFFKLLKNRVDYYFYIGTKNKMFYKYYGINNDKLIFMPYAVKDDFKTKKSSNFKLNKKILFCGKLIDKKRPFDLIKSLSQLKDSSINLVFAGDGYLNTNLVNLTTSLGLKSRVTFLGLLTQKQLIEVYSSVDLLVLPSGDGETWGLVVNEALSFNLPVIVSSRVGSSIDLCNENGFIFNYGDCENLSKVIEDFYSQTSEEIYQMRLNSRKIIEKFSFKTILENLENLNSSEKKYFNS